MYPSKFARSKYQPVVPAAAQTVWPEEPYTRNHGTVGRKKITFVGASYKFVHKVLRDMMLVGGFNDVECCVHDIDPEPMKIVGDLLERMARQSKTNVNVTRTLDRRKALKGADAVVLSITVGGREADARAAECCARYGIPVGIGDTLGPAAFARNLRAVPVVVRLVKEMEELCPQAIMLNFTNPMSALTAAMARNSSIPCFGLCHSADELWKFFSKVFQCRKSDLDMDVAGVNHQSFVLRLAVKGVDKTKEILEAVEASDAKLEDNLLDTKVEDVELQKDIYHVLKAWPTTGHTHLAEFYRHFFTERRKHLWTHEGHLRWAIRPGRPRYGNSECPQIIRDWAYGPEPVGDLHLITSEHAHEILWAMWTGEQYTRVLNILNRGEFIKGIRADACVEVLCTIEGRNIQAKQLALPPAIHSLVTNWTTIHHLSIEAALHCDVDAARQALMLDPHVGDIYDIDPLLEDFVTSLEEWLPRKWRTVQG